MDVELARMQCTPAGGGSGDLYNPREAVVTVETEGKTKKLGEHEHGMTLEFRACDLCCVDVMPAVLESRAASSSWAVFAAAAVSMFDVHRQIIQHSNGSYRCLVGSRAHT